MQVLETNHRGRLLRYDVVKKEAKTLLADLYMANGLALSPEEDYILIAETSIARIVRYVATHCSRHLYDITLCIALSNHHVSSRG